MKHRQILGLDIMRFIAAVMVMSFHLGYYGWAAQYGTTQNAFGHITSIEPLAPYTWFGWVGVEVFFVISGFVIAFSAQVASPFQFFMSRTTRLLPAVWICFIITLAVVLAGHLVPPREALVQAVHTAILLPWGPWLDGVYWTLGIEMSFYTVVFVLLFAHQVKRLEQVICVLGLASTIVWVAASLPLFARFSHLLDLRVTQLMLIPHGCFFALGVMFWLVADRGLTRGRAALIAMLLVGTVGEIVHTSHGFAPEFSALVPLLVFLVALALTIASIAFNDQLESWAGALAAPIRLMGLATYPLYLIHNVVGAYTERVVIEVGVNKYVAVGVAAVLMMTLAFVIAALIEPPVKAVLRRFLIRAGSAIGLEQSRGKAALSNKERSA